MQFRLNQDSPQARGLVFWTPLSTISTFDVVTRMTFTGSPAFALIGGRPAWYFNNSTSFVSAAGAVPVTAPPLTLSCWFNPDGIVDSDVIFGLGSSTAEDTYVIRIANATIMARTKAAG
ncbi:MAG: hypothetical protein ACREO2_09105, partial [Arenimonas sp.]